MEIKNNKREKVILVVSFGTTYHDTYRATIAACEDRIARAFPAYEVRRAFTSGIIRKILRERDDLHIPDTEEALQKIKEDGFSEVVIQPLHIIPGEEYHEKILKPAARFRDQFATLAVGKPLLFAREDYLAAVEALKLQLPKLEEGQAVVLMGHGSSHPANACYAMLQMVLMDTMPHVYLANVEGYPELANVIPKLKAGGIREVTLMPYMLVAGDHAQNDMAGDDDSWKAVLEREGFKVNIIMQGLGENTAYQDIYVRHIAECMKADAAAARQR